MRRTLLLALLALLLLPGRAAAAGDTVERARAELVKAGTLVDRSAAALRAGDREGAYRLARTAYLDHFEYAEVPLRLRDGALVLDLEYRFARMRGAIQDGASVGSVAGEARHIRAGLHDAALKVADKGWAAPAVAFAFSFSILFREGVEAVLLIAILLGALEAGRAASYRRPFALGVGAAIVASVATFALAALVIDVAPVDREVLEAVTALFAVVVLALVSFWLIARLEHKRWTEFMRARTSSAIAAGSGIAFAGLGFTAIYREGFETALFYQALTLFAPGLGLWVALGVVAAALALAGVAWAILKAGRTLPLKPMLVTGASILLLLSVTFIGNAVRSLQGADVISVTPVSAGIARLPVLLAELTGIHPSQEGLIAQVALALVYLLGAGWVFAWRPARERRRRAATTATA